MTQKYFGQFGSSMMCRMIASTGGTQTQQGHNGAATLLDWDYPGSWPIQTVTTVYTARSVVQLYRVLCPPGQV